MTSRRDFVKTTSLFSAGMLLSPSFSKHKRKAIGLQLYTVRDAMQADPAGTLAKVAAIGYNSIETATYTGTETFYGMDAAAFAKLAKQNGLTLRSGHYRLGEEQQNGADVKGTLLHDWQKAVDDASALGLSYMVCAYLSDNERKGLDHYKQVADDFNKAGEICKKANIQFCYHNHAFEFDKQGDQYPYDILLNQTDKNLVKMEMDLYWITKAAQSPEAIFNAHPGRFPLWHVKDMDNTPDKAFAEVGSGTIDFKEIFKHADKAGMKYFFVEQDKCPGDPFVSITKSYNYIKQNLV